MWYNVRVKTFPDGHKQYFWSENYISRDVPDELKTKKLKKSLLNLTMKVDFEII